MGRNGPGRLRRHRICVPKDPRGSQKGAEKQPGPPPLRDFREAEAAGTQAKLSSAAMLPEPRRRAFFSECLHPWNVVPRLMLGISGMREELSMEVPSSWATMMWSTRSMPMVFRANFRFWVVRISA